MIRCTLFIVLLTLSTQAEETYRTFTATEGRTLKARILSYDATTGKVQIEREDKKKITVPSTTFSKKDQTYIDKWHSVQTFLSAKDLKLTIKLVEEDDRKKEHEVDMGNGFGGGGRRGGGPSGITTVAIDKVTPVKYKLLIENKSDIELKNITLEYQIYYEQQKAVVDEKANENRSENSERPERYKAIDQKKVKTDTLRLKPIKPGASTSISTGTVPLIDRSASFAWGDKIDLKSDCNGAWIKLTMRGADGEKIVRDLTTSSSIMKKYSWDVPQEEAEEEPDVNATAPEK